MKKSRNIGGMIGAYWQRKVEVLGGKPVTLPVHLT